MIRSLYSGVSGLTTHQTGMDVIGNNIANVNSSGYKALRMTYRDIYYQTHRSPTGGKEAYAGNNPAEVGYGVQMGSIDKDMSQSSGKSTNNMWDVMLEGDGFFMTATFPQLNINSDLSAKSVQFTRLGNCTVDSYGNLVNANNRFLIGSRNSLAGLRATGEISENHLSDVKIKDRNGDDQINSSDITFRNTLNLEDLCQTAINAFTDEYGYLYGYDWEALLTAENQQTGNANVVYDFDGTAAEWTAIVAQGTEEMMKYVDTQQTLMNLNTLTADAGAGGAGGGTAQLPQGLAYRRYVDTTGAFLKDTAGANLPYNTLYTAIANANAQAPGEARDEAIKTAKAAVNTAGGIQDEIHWSDMESVTLGEDGCIYVQYGGETKFIARIEVAMFNNPYGLAEAGGTAFEKSSASGEATIRNPGDMGAGKVISNKLEMSNVNLANEFSDMIVTQRGYQANARIITVSDQMLEELVNLKR